MSTVEIVLALIGLVAAAYAILTRDIIPLAAAVILVSIVQLLILVRP